MPDGHDGRYPHAGHPDDDAWVSAPLDDLAGMIVWHDVDWARAQTAWLTTHTGRPVAVTLSTCRRCYTPLMLLHTTTDILVMELGTPWDGG